MNHDPHASLLMVEHMRAKSPRLYPTSLNISVCSISQFSAVARAPRITLLDRPHIPSSPSSSCKSTYTTLRALARKYARATSVSSRRNHPWLAHNENGICFASSGGVAANKLSLLSVLVSLVSSRHLYPGFSTSPLLALARLTPIGLLPALSQHSYSGLFSRSP